MAPSTNIRSASRTTSRNAKRIPRFVGVGELAYDHVFTESPDGLIYRFSAGGGSVGNILANLAAAGASSSFAGIGGADTAGDASLAELDAFGVDVAGGRLQKGRRTLLVHETLAQPQPSLFAEQRHEFSLRCPVCGHTPGQKRADQPTVVELTALLASRRQNIIIVDRLNAYATAAMRRGASDEHCLVALDVGRVGFIRYRSPAEIVSSLRLADVVFLAGKVFSFLRSRLDGEPSTWFRYFPGKLFLVGSGPEGLGVYDFRRATPMLQHFAPLSISPEKLVDDAGAGDAFFAHFLRQLAARSATRIRFRCLSFKEIATLINQSLENVRPVLESQGARGHLTGNGESRASILQRFKNRTVASIRKTLENEAACPFCQSDKKAISTKEKSSASASVYRSNLNQLADRISTLANRRSLLTEARRILPTKGTVFAVGTGGSYAAAGYFASLLNEMSDCFAQVVRPLDYLLMPG